ncbi:hypothetical protein BJF78_13610 [Pseudonocardia sp. CNS-139]|nr:hypothetical protein BJF78_13610 [Pseudonocardia sp. CNS-139]
MTPTSAAAPDGPVVAARGLGVVYQGVPACAHVDLDLSPGQVLGISGPSGSGKSTLLRLLAAVEVPTSGDLDLGGRAVVRAGRRVGRAPRPGYVMPILQDAVGSLDPRWPLWAGVTEPLTAPHRREPNLPRTRRERRAHAAAALAEVGLDDLDPDARPAALSVGQCQRAAVLRALLAEPALITADEPTAALDVVAADQVLTLLRRAARRGSAVVIVSHDRRALAGIADTVLTMSAGRLHPS